MEEPTSQTIKYGETLSMQTVHVADDTDTVNCVTWKDNIGKLEMGKSYSMKNVSVRVFDNIKSLTTTADSEIIEIEDIGSVKINEPEPMSSDTEIIITAASCTETFPCTSCARDIGVFNKLLSSINYSKLLNVHIVA